ncbi:MAG: maleylpyruvate isomerase N-terminal domain-containing protein [Anaerolineaceae bacterium]
MASQPEARAIADRFMYDTGNLKLLATQLPEGALARPVPALEWNVRQVLAHLAAGQLAYAETLERMTTGVTAFTAEDFERPRIAAEQVAGVSPLPLPKILDDFDSSLRRMVAQLNGLSEETLQLLVGERTLLAILHVWSDHAAGHAIQVLGALPELRGDPMLLNWLLYQDFSRQPAQFALQQTLFAEAREREANENDEMPNEEIL